MEFETYAMGAALFSVTFEVRLTPIDQHLLSVFFLFGITVNRIWYLTALKPLDWAVV